MAASQRQAGVWTRPKLRLLATTLGYPRDLLVDCIPPDMRKKQGMNSEDFQRSLDMGHFTTAVNLTWNLKTADYNVAVIKKCIQLLDSGIISFNELLSIRLAFFTYEQPYENGMKLDQDTLMKALKLEDIESLGEAHYERLMRHLNKQFNQEERNYGTITTDSKMLTEGPLLVRYRKEATVLQRKAYQWLKTMLKECHEQLKQGKGRHLTLPLPPLTDCQKLTRTSELTQGSSSASKSGVCSAKDSSGTRWQQEKDMNDWVWVVTVPPLKLGSYTARSLPPIFSAEELEEVQKRKEDLEYQMNTVKERAELELNWKIDYHLPGFRELSASRQDADSLLMKTTSGVGPKESELPLSPVKRSHSVSQAPKCQPGSPKKLPSVSTLKDSKCLPMKAQEKKQRNIQQILRWQNDRGQDKIVEPQGLLVHSHTPEPVSCPAQTSNPVSVMQPPAVMAVSELAEVIVE